MRTKNIYTMISTQHLLFKNLIINSTKVKNHLFFFLLFFPKLNVNTHIFNLVSYFFFFLI